MVFIGKAAARPAQNGDSHFFKRIDNIAAHTVDIGNIGIFADIKSLINASAQMLGKVTVNVLVDAGYFLIGINKIFFHNNSLR